MSRDLADPSTEGHLSPEDLAVLAEGAGRGGLRDRAVEHLSRCRSCMSAYGDVVRYRAGRLVIPEAFEAGGDPISGPEREGGGLHADFRVRIAWTAAAAFVVIALGMAALLTARRESGPITGPMTALLERASAEGLVIPGGEAGAARTIPSYRSGSLVDTDVESALDRLRANYERAPRDTREVHELAAGLVAAKKLDLARDYLAEGLRRAPDDARLLTMAGIVAYLGGEPTQAVRRLRDARRASPDDLTALLDLGLVLGETQDGIPEAADCFNSVIRRAPRSPLAERARRELASLERR